MMLPTHPRFPRWLASVVAALLGPPAFAAGHASAQTTEPAPVLEQRPAELTPELPAPNTPEAPAEAPSTPIEAPIEATPVPPPQVAPQTDAGGPQPAPPPSAPPAPAPPAAPPPAVVPPGQMEPLVAPQDQPSASEGEDAEGYAFHAFRYAARASGYVQSQYQNFKQSENQLSADGQRLLNQSGFFIPRARILIEGENKWSALVIEEDVANLGSANLGLQRAEATLHWRKDLATIPYLAVTFGMFRTPFGVEAERSARVRVFAENATVVQAFFPGQSDIGFRAQGGIGWLRYSVALVNGHPINEPRWGGRAPTKQGDILGRLGIDAKFGPMRLIGGASLLKGKGFSPGTAATKDSITARDVNEQGVVTTQNVKLVPGQAGVASQTFSRWGTGADLELRGHARQIWSFALRGEFLFGQNLDRGLFISDPVTQGFNGRSYGALGAFENLFWRTFMLDARYDFYEPNPDATSRVAGDLIKVPQRITTLSGIVGLQLPGTLTRLFAQYDRVKDHLALGTDGRPADLKNDRFTLRLQVSL